jgi:hypothetical protein
MKSSITSLIMMLTLGIAHIQSAVAEPTPTNHRALDPSGYISTEDPNDPSTHWIMHDQQKCDAALAELPKALEQIRKIRIADVSTEPMACLSQELLYRCKPIKSDVVCVIDGARDIMELETFNTLRYGLIITGISYTTPIEAEGRNNEFFPEDASFKSLISRYGEPIYTNGGRNFKDAKPPYWELVWANGVVSHYARKVDGILHIKLRIKLSPGLYGKFNDQFSQLNEIKRHEAAQEAARNAPVPKF